MIKINRKKVKNIKKILIIGNGFDLHHGLKTKYSDFLNFLKNPKKDKSYFFWREEIILYKINRIFFLKETYFLCLENEQNLFQREKLFLCQKKKLILGWQEKLILCWKEKFRKYENNCKEKIKEIFVKEIKEIKFENLWKKYFLAINKYNDDENKPWIDFERSIAIVFNYIFENENNAKHSKIWNQDLWKNERKFLKSFEVLWREGINIIEKILVDNYDYFRKNLFFLIYQFEEFKYFFNKYLNLEENKVDKIILNKKLKEEVFENENQLIFNFNYTNKIILKYNDHYELKKEKIIYIHGEINENFKKINIVLGSNEINRNINNNLFELRKDFQIVKNNLTINLETKIEEFLKNDLNFNLKVKELFENDLNFNLKVKIEEFNFENDLEIIIIGHGIGKTDWWFYRELFDFFIHKIKKMNFYKDKEKFNNGIWKNEIIKFFPKIIIYCHNETEKNEKIRLFLEFDRNLFLDLNKNNKIKWEEFN